MISSRKLINKAEEEELVLEVTADVHGDAVTGTSTESSRWSDWIPVFIFSILDIVAYFGAANLDNFLIIASKTFLDHKLLIESRDTAAEGGPGPESV